MAEKILNTRISLKVDTLENSLNPLKIKEFLKEECQECQNKFFPKSKRR